MEKNTQKVFVNMLGSCSISVNDKSISSHSMHSKKIWEVLSYLIINRNNEASQSQLISIIYGDEKNTNPLNALKTLIHRVRMALDELGVEGKDVITQRGGSYRWNNDYEVVLDVDVFEELVMKTQTLSMPKELRLETAKAAFNIYKGDFLPRFALEPWVIPLNAYYRLNYTSIVRELVELMTEENLNADIVEVCGQAIAIDPYDEFLYICQLRALINLGEYKTAMERYEKTTNMFYREFGITPSEELKSLYKQIVHSDRGIEMDINAVKEQLREPGEYTGAFFCEYEFFKSLYQLEVRASSRTGKPVHIGLLSVSPKLDVGELTTKQMNSAVEKLMKCLKSTLRKGDVFARYSVSQLIVMLPMTNMESAEKVLERVSKHFASTHTRSPGEIKYSFQAIDMVI